MPPTGPGPDAGPVVNPGGPTFSSMCNGTPTVLTGTVFAPNGTDPISNAFVYVPVSSGSFPATVSCELCNQPVDGYTANASTGSDGTFTLDISGLPVASQIKLTVNKGRFRRTTMVSVKACASNSIGPPHTVLPGKAVAGSDDIPKIAVATGVKDQLDVVLSAMGLDMNAGYDCFENRTTISPLNTPCGTRLAAQGSAAPQLTDLLKDESRLETYNILFISCAFGKYSTLSTSDRAAVTANLKTWVGKGGRIFTTDRSYDYIAQTFPNDVAFMNGNTTVDAANVGVGSVQTPATYNGQINDATLVQWLTVVGALPSGSKTIQLGGYLTQWSVVQSVPMSTVDVVDATNAQVQLAGGATMTGSYPQTVKFDVTPPGGTQACGRAIFSSYHTENPTQMVGASMLNAQERILEYLMFEAGSCLGPPIG
jgi:hypothetical protein